MKAKTEHSVNNNNNKFKFLKNLSFYKVQFFGTNNIIDFLNLFKFLNFMC